MRWLLSFLDQWGRNTAQQRQIRILEEELAEVCDENVRLAVENAELKGARAARRIRLPDSSCSTCGRTVTTCICGPRSIR